jgi:feruloyl esterase
MRAIETSLKRVVACALVLSGCGTHAGGVAESAGKPGQVIADQVIKPVMTCEQLMHADISRVTDAKAAVSSATVLDTPKGQFCQVSGTIEPSIAFEVDLPITGWTGRFLESPFGRATIDNAGGCAPALNGEFVVAADHLASVQWPDSSWTANLPLRIDQAYRANHVTAQAAKAVIRKFYGRAPRYSYFVGCSEGGREALVEAERYPEDFDGISAGSPVILDTVHNAFYHPWEDTANRRADGSRILLASRLNVIHDAVMAHCAASAGVMDDVLQQPTACQVDVAWMKCPEGVSDTSHCLTTEEAAVVRKLYYGPSDTAGHHFDMGGFPAGSERLWKLSSGSRAADPEANNGFSLRRLLPPPESDQSTTALESQFAYTPGWFDKVQELAPLFNAANTDLRPFQKRGGRLILWNGAEDLTVQPASSIAYYQGVQQQMGSALTDQFVRLFVVPGVGHCAGGEGASQLDVLSPLMAWVEQRRAPDALIAGKMQESPGGGGGGGGGQGRRPQPYASPAQPVIYSRPVYSYPYVAQYSGQGDPNAAASYTRGAAHAADPRALESEARALIGPDNQRLYSVRAGLLVPEAR